MPLSYTFEMISQISYFSAINFTSFNDFQQLATIIGFNFLYYFFIFLVLKIVYRVGLKILNIFF